MPGPLSNGHHQLSGNCQACHTDSFGGGEVVLQTCIDCHGDERKKPFDSHPKAKFSDPRNADLLADIDATNCITCHTEHKPEITLADGLTRPKDLCFHCHEAIAEERPSHEGMGFETCASSGCHNFHDNRALYTKFLIRHADSPWLAEEPVIPEKNFLASLELLIDYPRDDYPQEPLDSDHADAPAEALTDAAILESWSQSGHAQQGVNCSACHTDNLVDGSAADSVSGQADNWITAPGMQSCAACHAIEVETFIEGKHGMRIAAGLPPMTPALARIPMHEDAMHKELTCNNCHQAHDYDVVTASVDACMGCHTDQHSLAYEQSPHFTLWQSAVSGTAEFETGVSCATCHLPRTDMEVDDYNSRIVVNHNQNASLSPNSKMIRPVCLECHGLEFSINALADRALIESNFTGQPAHQTDSVSMARTLQAEHEKKKANK